ncbi:MAG: 50S ribosomal protein L33 [Candidatus Melainabacteria bacterium]
MAYKRRSPQLILACAECSERNYTLAPSQQMQTSGQRFETRKYCPRCTAHTLHKETK